jgi:hypothetical protein
MIPCSVEVLGPFCFKTCRSLLSLSFESPSRLRRIELGTFALSSLESIVIPCTTEVLGPSCFEWCLSLSSVAFESPSRLRRIESNAFSWSSLQSIVIPRSVEFIDVSAFYDAELSSCEIESGNDRFIVEHEFLIDNLSHKLIRNFSNSSDITIPSSIEILGTSCFRSCESLSSLSFELPSHLRRIESGAFSWSSPQSIVITRSVEFIDVSAFCDVKLLSCDIESGNDRFVVEHEFLIDISVTN